MSLLSRMLNKRVKNKLTKKRGYGLEMGDLKDNGKGYSVGKTG